MQNEMNSLWDSMSADPMAA
jgi:peroxin-5